MELDFCKSGIKPKKASQRDYESFTSNNNRSQNKFRDAFQQQVSGILTMQI